MNKRFILIVLDGFGIGAMEDVLIDRPHDVGSNTALNVIKECNSEWKNLESLGLMNLLKYESKEMKKVDNCIVGKSKLIHYGADSFFGHQEIMGSMPLRVDEKPLSVFIDVIMDKLLENNIQAKLIENDFGNVIEVENSFIIGDNIETDPGQAINITASLNDMDFSRVVEIARLVRDVVSVPRVIVFGSNETNMIKIRSSIKSLNQGYVGVDAPESGVYTNSYQCVHLGYGINVDEQVGSKLASNEIKSLYMGKVADVVYNHFGDNIPGVDTLTLMNELIKQMDNDEYGFIALNIQETDLAGHAQDSHKLNKVVNIVDEKLTIVFDKLKNDDILLIMADHGDDPTIGHPQHTREYVPLLIKTNKSLQIDLGIRNTMADVGATIVDYLVGDELIHGESFLDELEL